VYGDNVGRWQVESKGSSSLTVVGLCDVRRSRVHGGCS